MKKNIMKIHKYPLVAILVSIILFIIPFFWLEPGQMDIGGDSGRLFFYNPLLYLKTQILYGVTTSGTGGEAISYFIIPFMTLLVLLKSVFTSPTVLISIVNGLKLSIAFISCYFIVKELVDDKKIKSIFSLEVSSIISSLFYVLAPPMIFSGWERSILSHTQIFLNPLMFLFLLKYINTHKVIYLLSALIVSYIFSGNFSYFAAPPFFAFYPLALSFLFIYAIVIISFIVYV